jgi:hypothetical protein
MLAIARRGVIRSRASRRAGATPDSDVVVPRKPPAAPASAGPPRSGAAERHEHHEHASSDLQHALVDRPERPRPEDRPRHARGQHHRGAAAVDRVVQAHHGPEADRAGHPHDRGDHERQREPEGQQPRQQDKPEPEPGGPAHERRGEDPDPGNREHQAASIGYNALSITS